MTPELVIFDCDGVLVDSEPATDVVISDFLNHHGLPVTPAEVHRLFVGGTMQSVGEEAMRRGATLPDGWLDQLYGAVFDRLRAGVPVIAGVTELLHRLEQAGIRVAIASNGPVEKMKITLRPAGLWDRFAPHIYSGHDHGPKPAPDMILRIMADAGVTSGKTVMIDDSAPGCRSAQAAGIACFGYVADGDPARLDGTGATPVTSMQAIAQALDLP